MVSVLPPTAACAVRTVAAACWLAAGGVLAWEVVAAAAVIPPPMAAAAARLMLAMMILGGRMGLAPWILTMHYLLIRLVEVRGSLGGRVIPAVRQPGAPQRGGYGRDLRWSRP